jgi:hypothetical protein
VLLESVFISAVYVSKLTKKLFKGSSLTECLSENERLASRIAKLLSFIFFYHYIIINPIIKYPGS